MLGFQCAKYNAVMGKHVPEPRKANWHLRGKQNSVLGGLERFWSSGLSRKQAALGGLEWHETAEGVFCLAVIGDQGGDFCGLWLSSMVFSRSHLASPRLCKLVCRTGTMTSVLSALLR